MSKKLIFHIPFELSEGQVSGTFIRPVKMQNAFKDLGYEVFEVSGNASVRRKKMDEILELLKKGERFEFMYSECSTEPTLLTEKHHLPLNPFLDFGFFGRIKKHNIPIGLFYRDVYWSFPFYGEGMPGWKKKMARAFYKYDLKQYNRFVDVLFLPSLKMIGSIPFRMKMDVIELPPAASLESGPTRGDQNEEIDGVKILYVGGVGLLYRMQMLFAAVAENENIELTVCCRESEWEDNKELYNEYLDKPNISIVHEKGKGLENLFKKHNAVSAVFEPSEYREFAMPLKLFEYLQHHKPIISTRNNAVGDFVEKNNVGWTVNYDLKTINSLLQELQNNPKLIKEKSDVIAEVISHHTWNDRARKAAEVLTESS